MGEQETTRGGPPATDEGQGQTDLEYDLAHEAMTAPTRPKARDPLTYVATQPAAGAQDAGGDYEYDLSHDVPGR